MGLVTHPTLGLLVACTVMAPVSVPIYFSPFLRAFWIDSSRWCRMV